MFNVGGTSAGGGAGGLWGNNLFLSLLSQYGASMAGEGSVAAGLNRINQGVIAAQSKAKEQKRQQDLMTKLLGQGVDVSSDAEGGLTLKAGSLGDLTKILSDYREGGSELEVPEGGPRSEPGILELAAQDYTSDQNLRNETLRGFLGGVTPNPTSSSPDVPVSGIPDYSDLVGLTPQDMSKALAGAQETELLRQRIEDSLSARQTALAKAGIDKRYKESLIGQAEARTKKTLSELDEEVQKSPLEVPGLGELTMDQWDALPMKTRAYSYYAFDAKQRDEEVVSYNRWIQDTDEPTAKEIYDIAKDDEDFKNFYFESKRAGAMNLGDVIERREATADVDVEKYFTDPEGLVEYVDKRISSREVQDKLFQFSSKDRAKETIREKERIVDRKIKAAGEVISKRVDKDEGVFIWVVKWPSGNISEVKYAY